MKYSKLLTYRLAEDLRFPDFVKREVVIFRKGEAFTYETNNKIAGGESVFVADDGILLAASVVKKIEKDAKRQIMLSPAQWDRLMYANLAQEIDELKRQSI